MWRLCVSLVACLVRTMSACGSIRKSDRGPDGALENRPSSLGAGGTDAPTVRQGAELVLPGFTQTDAEEDALSLAVLGFGNTSTAAYADFHFLGY